MKYLLVLVMLIASPAWAEWTLIGSNDEFTQYIDIATIRRNGNFVKIWSLPDNKRVITSPSSGISYLSEKSYWEYDCKEGRSRVLAFTWFSGQMGNGTVVYSNSETSMKWFPVQPGSMGETLGKIACGKF